MTTLRYVQENVNKHASNPWDIGTELSLYSLTFCFFQKLLRSFMRRVPAQIIIIQPEFTRGGWHTLSRSSAGSLGYGVFQAMLHVCPEHTIRCQRTVRKPRLIAHEQEVGVNWMAVESLRSCGRYSAVSRAIVSLSGVEEVWPRFADGHSGNALHQDEHLVAFHHECGGNINNNRGQHWGDSYLCSFISRPHHRSTGSSSHGYLEDRLRATSHLVFRS